MFIPDLNKICDVKLDGQGDGGGRSSAAAIKRSLLRVEQTTTLDGKPRPEFDMTLWVDSGGQVLKSVERHHGRDGHLPDDPGRRPTAPTARPSSTRSLNSIIKVTHKITKPRGDAATSRYRVTLKDDDPAQIFPTDRRQTLRPGADQERRRSSRSRPPGPTTARAGPEQVDAEFLRPNALITSDDPRSSSWPARPSATRPTPGRRRAGSSSGSPQNITDKNFKTAFAPASEVARNLSGDCTEHGVLTAAMCRAVGVPARVVVGLVYADNLGGFGFHMWNEVYVNRRWVAIDATFDQTSVDAVHIKLSDTSLDGVSPYETFLPVVRVLGKMTLEPHRDPLSANRRPDGPMADARRVAGESGAAACPAGSRSVDCQIAGAPRIPPGHAPRTRRVLTMTRHPTLGPVVSLCGAACSPGRSPGRALRLAPDRRPARVGRRRPTGPLVLQALQANPVTAPYRPLDLRSRRPGRARRAGRHEADPRRRDPDWRSRSGYPIRDDLVIDTAAAHRVAAPVPAQAGTADLGRRRHGPVAGR